MNMYGISHSVEPLRQKLNGQSPKDAASTTSKVFIQKPGLDCTVLIFGGLSRNLRARALSPQQGSFLPSSGSRGEKHSPSLCGLRRTEGNKEKRPILMLLSINRM